MITHEMTHIWQFAMQVMARISMIPWNASAYGKKKTSVEMDLLQTISSRTHNKTIPTYVFISVKCWNLTSPIPQKGMSDSFGKKWLENEKQIKT